MLTAFIILQVLGGMTAMSIWSYQFHRGDWDHWQSTPEGFVLIGYLILACVWPLGLAFLIGSLAHGHALKAKEQKKLKAAQEAREERLLAEAGL